MAIASHIFLPMKKQAGFSPLSANVSFAFLMMFVLNPPQSDEFELMATTQQRAESLSSLLRKPPPTAPNSFRQDCNSSRYSFRGTIIDENLWYLALDISFIAEVIFSVLLTEFILSFISLSEAISVQNFCR